jgi:hypothetical protein
MTPRAPERSEGGEAINKRKSAKPTTEERR